VVVVAVVVAAAVAGIVVIALSFPFPSSLSKFNVPRNENVKIFSHAVLGMCYFSCPHCNVNEL